MARKKEIEGFVKAVENLTFWRKGAARVERVFRPDFEAIGQVHVQQARTALPLPGASHRSGCLERYYTSIQPDLAVLKYFQCRDRRHGGSLE